MTDTKRSEPAGTSPRNLVLCCDGTSNEPNSASTNVVRLFRCLKKDDRQIVFYDPGVGTSGILDLWKRRTNRVKALAAQATGYGLDQHVTDAYRFLCEHYQPGDRIAIFGFSRGAYSARALAGLIHQIGVLRPEQANLASFALKAYKQSSDQDDLAIGWSFARALGTRRATIALLGLWDTVGSMIAPLKDRVGFGLTSLPYTHSNPSVACIRHAMALDEKRRMFRLDHWVPGDFAGDPFDTSDNRPQDVKQVWFAGAHGDVGGGHPEEQSGLAKVSLLWMAGEADALGFKVDRKMLDRIGRGIQPATEKRKYTPDDPHGQIHLQPAGGWWLLEYAPKAARHREWPKRRTFLGLYLPRGEPRPLDASALLHRSVIERAAKGYTPVNLTEPIESYPVEETRLP
jgi:uncharacterized protein (DUF2235 family)